MNGMVRWSVQTPRRVSRRSIRAEWRSSVLGALGGLAMVLLLAAGIAVAVIFAATLAVVMVLTTLLLSLSALAWRMRPRPVAQRNAVASPQGGHAWIAYVQDGSSP